MISHKMLLIFVVFVTVVSAVPSLLARPSLEVPACPAVGTVSYNTSVPDQGLFPLTQVDLCYDDSSIKIKFTAFEEKNFYCICYQFPLLPASAYGPRQPGTLLTPGHRQPKPDHQWRDIQLRGDGGIHRT